jgi:propanol-preferring alcohol dehydrogenase
MRAMVLENMGEPLKMRMVSHPIPKDIEILIKVHACGICRTDLHVVDGELNEPKLPLIPGHQIVGTIVEKGKNVISLNVGDRVGVSWLGYSCGVCEFCRTNRENLCDYAKYTGYQIDGGFAEFCVAHANYCFPIPEGYSNELAAPLLCAGLIGYRAYRKLKDVKRIGIYGFGSAAHIVTQVAVSKGQEIYAFTRTDDIEAQKFAVKMGAIWTGNSEQIPPVSLDGAIIFAPEGKLVPLALKAVKKGSLVVCAGIHMSDIPSFPYQLLWGERKICSIANLTRQDGEQFLALAPKVPVHTEITTFQLAKVNEALQALRTGQVTGAIVILMD